MERRAHEATRQVELGGLDCRDGHPFQPGRVSTGWCLLHCAGRERSILGTEVAFIPKDSKHNSLDPELKFCSLQMGLAMPVLPGWWGTLSFIPEPPSRCLLTAHQILVLLYVLGKTEECISSVRDTVAREVRPMSHFIDY